jgi:CheY-like chemotaxis protein
MRVLRGRSMSTILIADDTPSFREPIAAVLRLRGYQTLCAANGMEALDILASQVPDLILLDMAMPVMDGPTFLRRLRGREEWKHIPVIMLTAMSEKQSAPDGAELGVAEYLVKSRFSLQEMVTRISKRLAISPRL